MTMNAYDECDRDFEPTEPTICLASDSGDIQYPSLDPPLYQCNLAGWKLYQPVLTLSS